MKFSNPFKSKGKGKKIMSENQNTENIENVENVENIEQNEQTEQNEQPTYEDLQAKIQELEGMIKDEQLRALANEQNLRRRFQDEIQSAHKFASQKFAQEMLTVKDYLEMALLDKSGNFDALKMGVTMTLNELTKAFEQTNIKEIAIQLGDKLDPHQHQAMQEIPSDQPAGSIAGVLKKGYIMNDRILRPAMVTVAKKAD